jgi:hypothetical protein
MVTVALRPKYCTSESPSKSTKNEPKTENDFEPDSTRISSKPVPRNADPSRWSTDAGIKIDFSNKHPENASASILETLEVGGNITEVIDTHSEKAFRQIR